MADVFISYAREDRPRAEQIARGLEAVGLQSFWDNEIPPGQSWADYIENKLSQCKVVIVLWSQHSTKSQWVREEARMGRDRGRLIPVLLDGSMPPLGFGEVQAADLSAWNGDHNHADWIRLTRAVQSAAGAQPAPNAAPSPPPAQAAWSPPPPQQSAWTQTAAPGQALSPIAYVQKCFRLYVDGKGRARRAEYWWWVLFTVIVSVATTLLDMALFGYSEFTGQPNNPIINMLVSLALLPPSVSVMSRRFHDIGLNGWLVAAVFGAMCVGYFIVGFETASGGSGLIGNLIVVAVAIGAIVFLVRPSQPGPNQYGPNPKGL